MSARHRIVTRQGIGSATPQGETVSCECGIQGSAGDVSEHVRRYAPPVDPVEVKVGRIRFGQLTRDTDRTHVELAGFPERVYVLVVLQPGATTEEAIAQASAALAQVAAPDRLRADGQL